MAKDSTSGSTMWGRLETARGRRAFAWRSIAGCRARRSRERARRSRRCEGRPTVPRRLPRERPRPPARAARANDECRSRGRGEAVRGGSEQRGALPVRAGRSRGGSP
jgi:hypothetical protein